MIYLVQIFSLLLSYVLFRSDYILAKLSRRNNEARPGLERLKDESLFPRRYAFSHALNINIIVTLLFIFAAGRYLYRWQNSFVIYLVYILAVFVITELLLLAKDLLKKKFEIIRENKRSYGLMIFFAIFGGLSLFIAALAYFIPTWFYNYFGNLTADQFIFLISDGSGDATADANAQVANFMIAPCLAFAILGLKYAILPSNIIFKKKGSSDKEVNNVDSVKLKKKDLVFGRTLQLCLKSLISIVLAISSIVYAFHTLPIMTVIKSQFNPSTFIEDNYVDPSDVLEFPDKPRNLIHIYMESVENSYYDKSIGGYGEDNLMPDLAKLNKEAVHFSNSDKLFGGPHQTYGASHSVAGMLNMGAGMSMKTAVKGGTAKPMLYPHFPTVGDILHKQGYNTEIMLGARAAWGGLGNYYIEHGDFKVFDLDYAREKGYVDKDYKVWWGYEDDKLYEFAKEELLRLSSENKPFYFILENADTHFPDGYVSPKMKDKPFSSQYANVIHYSQAEVVKFVDWLKKQDFYKDTTIVITGDHQSMDKKFFKDWDKSYERTVVNMFINSALDKPKEDRMFNRDFAPFDIFPTTLASLGIKIKGDRVGLGTNLYSDKKTLVEEYGLERVNDELSRPSFFYTNYRQK